MFGYRLFKVAGSLMILTLTQWLPIRLGLAPLSLFTMSCCIVWIMAKAYLAQQYRAIVSR